MKVPSFFRFLEKTNVVVHDKVVTVPNIVTASGFFSAAAFAYFYATHEYMLAFIAFCFMAGSDLLDGALARALGQHSRLGKKLDWLRDWWFGVMFALAVVFDFLSGGWVFCFALALAETEILLRTKTERLEEASGGKRHLSFKVHTAITVLAAGALSAIPAFGLLASMSAENIVIVIVAVVFVTTYKTALSLQK